MDIGPRETSAAYGQRRATETGLPYVTFSTEPNGDGPTSLYVGWTPSAIRDAHTLSGYLWMTVRRPNFVTTSLRLDPDPRHYPAQG